MSVNEAECEDIASACIKNNTIVAVCHVLRYYVWIYNFRLHLIRSKFSILTKTDFVFNYRYFPPCVKIREIIDSGVLGDIITIDHRENIGFYHFAHSFVRGNWRNEAGSTFSLLAKSCHDIDLIQYWMGDKKCLQVWHEC